MCPEGVTVKRQFNRCVISCAIVITIHAVALQFSSERLGERRPIILVGVCNSVIINQNRVIICEESKNGGVECLR